MTAIPAESEEDGHEGIDRKEKAKTAQEQWW